MAGYIRQDVTDQISNGNTINAPPLDGEFDAIPSAFTAVTGHKHDGSVGEGAWAHFRWSDRNLYSSSDAYL